MKLTKQLAVLTSTLILTLSARAQTLPADVATLKTTTQNLGAALHALAAYPDQLTPANDKLIGSVLYDYDALAKDLAAPPATIANFDTAVNTCKADVTTLATPLQPFFGGAAATYTLDNSITFLGGTHQKICVSLARDLNDLKVDFDDAALQAGAAKIATIDQTNVTARLAEHLHQLSVDLARLTLSGAKISNIAFDPSNTNDSYYAPTFFISTGARFLSPYALTLNPGGTNAAVTKNQKSSVSFLDLSFYNRYVMHPPSGDLRDGSIDTIWFGYGNPLNSIDVALRMGFNFDSGTSSSNLSASTVVGGGDVYMRGDIGLPIWRCRNPTWLHQITLEISGAATTDFNFIEVHPEFFIGPGYQVSFPNISGTTNCPGFIFARIGESYIETPAISPTNPGDTTLNVPAPGGIPAYKSEWVPSAGVTVLFAVGNVSLWAESNVYFHKSPAPWNVSVGASLSGQQIVNIFKGTSGTNSTN